MKSTTKKNEKTSVCFVMMIALAISSVAIIVTGIIIPPPGSIDKTILVAVGLMFAFATLFLVRETVLNGKHAKLSHGQTSLEINDGKEERVEP